MLIAVACVALPLRWTWSVRSVRTSDAPFASRRARLATARDADDFAVVTQALASAVEAASRVSTRASPPPDSTKTIRRGQAQMPQATDAPVAGRLVALRAAFVCDIGRAA